MPLTRRALLRRSAAGLAVLYAGDAAAAPLPPNRLRALRGAVRGRVFAPGDRGYAAARAVYNKRYNGIRPPAVVQVADPADVVAVVELGQPLRRAARGALRRPRLQRRLDRQHAGRGRPRPARRCAAVERRDRHDRARRAADRGRRRALPARRRHPARVVPDGGARRAPARRRHGAGRARLGPDARQRRVVPGRDGGRPAPHGERRARTRTCSGRCAAAAGASGSSPRCGCGRTAWRRRGGSRSTSGGPPERSCWRRGTTWRRRRRAR